MSEGQKPRAPCPLAGPLLTGQCSSYTFAFRNRNFSVIWLVGDSVLHANTSLTCSMGGQFTTFHQHKLFPLYDSSSETNGPNLMKLHTNVPSVNLFQSCSNGSGPLHKRATKGQKGKITEQTSKIFLLETTGPICKYFTQMFLRWPSFKVVQSAS